MPVRRQAPIEIRDITFNDDMHRLDLQGVEWWMEITNPSKRIGVDCVAYLDRVEDENGNELRINRAPMRWDNTTDTGYIGPEDTGRFQIFETHKVSTPQGPSHVIDLSFAKSKPTDFLAIPTVRQAAEYFVSFRVSVHGTPPRYAVIRFRPIDVEIHRITAGHKVADPIRLILREGKPQYGELAASLRSVPSI